MLPLNGHHFYIYYKGIDVFSEETSELKSVKAVERKSISVDFNETLSEEAFLNELVTNELKSVKAVEST